MKYELERASLNLLSITLFHNYCSQVPFFCFWWGSGIQNVEKLKFSLACKLFFLAKVDFFFLPASVKNLILGKLAKNMFLREKQLN